MNFNTNIWFLPNSGKLGLLRYVLASPRSRVSFKSMTDRLYSLPIKTFNGALKEADSPRSFQLKNFEMGIKLLQI